MAYDPHTGTSVIFGGWLTGTGVLGDTWIWTGTNWAHMSPSTSPSPRYDARMAYSPTLGGLVLYGGTANGSTSLGDTWVWNGVTWTQLATGGPSGRSSSTLATDPATGGVVLFGGFPDSSATPLSDTWVFDGTSWVQLSPSRSPEARAWASLANIADGRAVLFGGANYEGNLTTTWTWDGADWTPQNPTTAPSARSSAALVQNDASGSVLIWGGDNSEKSVDTWTFTPNPPGTNLSPTIGDVGAGSSPGEITASVDTRYLNTAITLEFGPTASYGSTIPYAPLNMPTVPPIVATWNVYSALSAAGSLHYRVVATNAYGTTTSPDSVISMPPPDTTPPTVRVLAPVATFATSTRVAVSWTATDASGIASSAVRWARQPATGGPLTPWATPRGWSGVTAQAVSIKAAPGYRYCFQVMAWDKSNNPSGWTPARCTAVPFDDRALATSSGWSRRSAKGWIANTSTATTKFGAYLTRGSIKTRQLGLIASACPTCGKVVVFIGKSRVGTFSLYSSRTISRKALLAPRFATLRTGPVKIQVVSSGKLVRVDGLISTAW